MADYLLDARTQIFKPTMAMIGYVAENMRQADVDEVYALSGWSPLKALTISALHSELALCAVHDGEPAVIWGCYVPAAVYAEAVPWLLGTAAVERNAKRFLRQSVLWRDEMLQRYGTLHNVVDERNTVSKRWLAWLGFTIDPPVIMGFEGRPFHRFHMEA